MSEVIQISLDSQGRIVIPSTFRNHPGLSQGVILVVEEGEKDGLFLRIQKERSRRVLDLVQRVGL